jgi:hypothetical protein
MKIAPRRVALVLVTLAAGGLIAACGSASSSSSSSTTSTTASSAAASPSSSSGSNSSRTARRTALVTCLKQHGVTLPTPPAGGAGRGTGTGTTGTGTTPRRFFGGGGAFANNPKLRAAMQACGARFGFGAGGGQGFRSPAARQRVTNYVACVRKNGYDLPNPNFSGSGPIFPANVQSNPRFQAASKKCQNLLIPPRGSGSGGSSTTAGA